MAKFKSRKECAEVIKTARNAFRIERDPFKRKAVKDLEALAMELLGMKDEELYR